MTAVGSFRTISLLSQCNNQLERAQQTADFDQQCETGVLALHASLESYRSQLNALRQESTSLDAIQVSSFLLHRVCRMRTSFLGSRVCNNSACDVNET